MIYSVVVEEIQVLLQSLWENYIVSTNLPITLVPVMDSSSGSVVPGRDPI